MSVTQDGWQVVNDWAAQIAGMGRLALNEQPVSRVPRTPIDAAAETLKSCLPHLHRPWHVWRMHALDIVRDNREDRTALERLVIRRYKDALAQFRETGEVSR